ncbi:MAG: hypothetical protein GWP10_09275 [Nitrospiraceae bacterium]|nr:hypothetical protein [Nitrospiraceae bacterium]
MISSLVKSGVSILLLSAVLISFLYIVGILLIGIIVFAILISVIFILLAAVLALYYSLTKKPHLENHGNWNLGRIRGK